MKKNERLDTKTYVTWDSDEPIAGLIAHKVAHRLRFPDGVKGFNYIDESKRITRRPSFRAVLVDELGFPWLSNSSRSVYRVSGTPYVLKTFEYRTSDHEGIISGTAFVDNWERQSLSEFDTWMLIKQELPTASQERYVPSYAAGSVAIPNFQDPYRRYQTINFSLQRFTDLSMPGSFEGVSDYEFSDLITEELDSIGVEVRDVRGGNVGVDLDRQRWVCFDYAL